MDASDSGAHRKRVGIAQRLQDKNLREMLQGSGVGLLVKVLSAGCAFLMNIVVARTLGATESGLFFLGLTIVSLVAAVGQFGLNNTLVRFLAGYYQSGDIPLLHGVYRKAMLWSGLLSLLLFFLILLGNRFLVNNFFDQPGFGDVLWVMCFAVPFVSLYNLHAQALQGLKKVVKAMTTLNLVVPVMLLVSVFFLPVNSAVDVAWLYLVASALALLAGWVWWLQSAPSATEKTNCPNKLLLNSCIPLWGVMMLAQLINWSSQLLLGATGSPEDVALFSVAQRTASLTSFVLIAVNSIAAPKFAAMYSQGDMEGLKKIALWSVRLMLLAAIPVLAFMLIIPEWLMGLFGPEFRIGATALIILALGQFINVATGSVGYLLSMTGHERELRFNVLISTILGIALGAWLIPIYSVTGGAAATAIAVASQNLLGVLQVKRKLGFNTLAFWQKA